MFLLILESLGSTELLFILVIALVFFGPRKLPQLSRSLGKGIAEFRKASDDFKRTWEREVALENLLPQENDNRVSRPEDNSIMNPDVNDQGFQEPAIEPVAAEHVIARQTKLNSELDATDPATTAGQATVDDATIDNEPIQPQPPRKQDWL